MENKNTEPQDLVDEQVATEPQLSNFAEADKETIKAVHNVSYSAQEVDKQVAVETVLFKSDDYKYKNTKRGIFSVHYCAERVKRPNYMTYM